MSIGIPGIDIIGLSERGRTIALGNYSFSLARLSTDPLFYFDLSVSNAVAGSHYQIQRQDTKAEIGSGTLTTGDDTITALPAYSVNQSMLMTIRKSDSSPYYVVFDTAFIANKNGSAVYVLQIQENY